MGNVIHSAKLMLDLVGSPVPVPPKPGQMVVGEAARPHDLAARLIVFRFFDADGPVLNHGTQKRLGNPIGHLVLAAGRKYRSKVCIMISVTPQAV